MELPWVNNMEDIMYIKHKFGFLSFKERRKRFIDTFNLINVKDSYYKNDDIIVKIEGKIVTIIFTNDKKSDYRTQIKKYFYN